MNVSTRYTCRWATAGTEEKRKFVHVCSLSLLVASILQLLRFTLEAFSFASFSI